MLNDLKQWSASKDRYIEVSRKLDKEFRVIEEDREAFFYCLAGWVWIRHDNLCGYVREAYYGITKKTPYSLMRQAYGLTRDLVSAISLCIRKPKMATGKVPEVLIFYNGFSSGSRMGGLYDRVRHEVACLDFHLKDTLKGSRKTPLQSVYSYISLALVAKSLIRCWGIYLTNKKKYPFGGLITMAHVFNALLFHECLLSCFAKAKPRFVLTQVSLNNPYARNLFEACRVSGVTSINLVQKPIAPLSIPFTAGVCKASRGLPDHIITASQYNYSILRNHVSHQSELHLGYIDGTILDSCKDSKPDYIIKVILILGVDEKINQSLVEHSWKQLEAHCKNIYLRPHPLLELSAQCDLLKFISNNGIKVECESWESVILPGQTLCVSVRSAAQSEAAAFGAYCLWAPFLEDASCVMHFLIDELGFVAEEQKEFGEAISRYFLDPKFRSLMWYKQAKALEMFSPEGSAYKAFSDIIGLNPKCSRE